MITANEENPYLEKLKFQEAMKQMNFTRKWQNVNKKKTNQIKNI